ncbi:MAG TPA: hypothetical protein ENH82_11400 [bacterium]|nr:hypothetical protein [bacterium]
MTDTEIMDKIKEYITYFNDKTDFLKSKFHCRHCDTDIENASWNDFLHKISACNNCMVDITQLGQMNGNGMAFLRKLYEKYPDDKRWQVVYRTFWSEL